MAISRLKRADCTSSAVALARAERARARSSGVRTDLREPLAERGPTDEDEGDGEGRADAGRAAGVKDGDETAAEEGLRGGAGEAQTE